MINSYKIKREENLKNSINREKEYIKDLKETIDSYSIKNGRFLISFLIFLFIIFTIAVNTTHKDLLFNSLISFPIIRWELPTTVFYAVAPLIILVFHFNILFSLSEHFKRLNQWLNIKDLKIEKKHFLIKPFIFNHLLVYRDKTTFYEKLIYGLLVFIYGLILIMLPTYTLIIIQCHFITNYHSVILFLDLLIGTYFIYELDKVVFKFSRKTHYFIIIFNIIFLPLIFYYTSIKLLSIPKTNEETIFCIKISKIIDRNLYLTNETLVKSPPSDILIASLLQQGKTLEEIWTEHSKGLNLEYLDINFNLERMNIPYNFDFKKLTIIDRNLDFANFKNSKMYNTSFYLTSLNNVNFTETKLQNVNFEYAYLNNVDLSRSDLNNTNFTFSILDNTSLTGSNLSNTKFKFTTFIGKIDISYNQLCQNKFIAKHFLDKNTSPYYQFYINEKCPQEFKNQLVKEFGFKFENNNSKREI